MKILYPNANVRIQNGCVKMNVELLTTTDIHWLEEIRKDKKGASFHSLSIKRSGTGLVIILSQ